MNVRVSKNFLIILACDALLVCGSFYLANLLRFEFAIPYWAMEKITWMLPYVLAFKLVSFFFFDLYRGMWRYTSLNDMVNVVKASSIGTLAVIVFILYTNRFQNISRAAFLMDWCFTIAAVTGLRLATRLVFERSGRTTGVFSVLAGILKRENRQGTAVLIIGAGKCGEMIFREIRSNPSIPYKIVGFLDDDPAKLGRKIHGIPVLANVDALAQAADITGAREVIIAIPQASAERMRQIIARCKDCGIESKTIPGMGELINGRVTISALRSVEYRDLLGREQVKLDNARIGGYLGGKTVMVTGAAGSIGEGLCTQICRYAPDTLILFEKAESRLYELDLELKKEFGRIKVIPVLGDVQHVHELTSVFEAFRPRIVFHAAAYKHVPMLEIHPWKAVDNNVTGTENLVRVSVAHGVEKFVFVSTDKAVNPTNVMGATKRVAEIIIQKISRQENSKTRFIIVRFGNVIGSAGSVIPLFKRQIKQGGPVTVTHREMTRYFMLIPEACQLILQAGAMGNGGEIFVLEMGDPVKIDTMARDLIRFFGYEPDTDIPIVYTGLRPGEKLFEELMTMDERIVPTEHDKILVFRSLDVNGTGLDRHLTRLRAAAATPKDANGIKGVLKDIVPEYRPHDWHKAN